MLQSPGDGPTAAKLGWHSAVTRPRDPQEAGDLAPAGPPRLVSGTVCSLARPWPPSLPLWIGTCQLKQDKDRTQTAPRATAPNPRSGSRTVPGWAGRDSKTLLPSWPELFPCSSPASPCFPPSLLHRCLWILGPRWAVCPPHLLSQQPHPPIHFGQ